MQLPVHDTCSCLLLLLLILQTSMVVALRFKYPVTWTICTFYGDEFAPTPNSLSKLRSSPHPDRLTSPLFWIFSVYACFLPREACSKYHYSMYGGILPVNVLSCLSLQAFSHDVPAIWWTSYPRKRLQICPCTCLGCYSILPIPFSASSFLHLSADYSNDAWHWIIYGGIVDTLGIQLTRSGPLCGHYLPALLPFTDQAIRVDCWYLLNAMQYYCSKL